jgi:hypothetical protein
MSNEYNLMPLLTSTPYGVLPIAMVAATAKSVLQVATPSTTDIEVLGWGISFNGVTSTAVPVQCELFWTATGATVTAQSPAPWGNAMQPASLCVSGTAATGINAGTETAPAAQVNMVDAQFVHPQSGYAVWFPEGHREKVSVSSFLRLRVTAAAVVSVIPWVVWKEPAV